MRQSFWKAASISLVAYTLAILIGFCSSFRFTLFAIPVLQITWTLFCAIRVIQLRRGGGHRTDALPSDRESYGFSLGGLISSSGLLVAFIVLTQIV